MSIKKLLGLFALLVGISTMGEGNTMQGGSPKCCASANRGNPAACQTCCQKKWQGNIVKKERCFNNCKTGTCR